MSKIGDEFKWYAKLKCPECGYEWIYDWNFLNPIDIHNPLAGPMGVPREYVTIECPKCGEKSPQDLVGNLYNPPLSDEEWDKFFDKMKKKEERRKKLKELFSLKKEE